MRQPIVATHEQPATQEMPLTFIGRPALYTQRNDPQGRASRDGAPSPIAYFRQVTENSWRSRIPATALYSLVLRQLSGSYIILSSDARSLSVQTDWDKFFVGGRLFRNRLSVSLFPISKAESEVVIMNKVEYFRSQEERTGMGEADWIPTQDVTNEKSELIDSLSRIAQAMRVAQAR